MMKVFPIKALQGLAIPSPTLDPFNPISYSAVPIATIKSTSTIQVFAILKSKKKLEFTANRRQQEATKSKISRSYLYWYNNHELESSSFFLISGGEDDVGRCLEDYYILSIKDWKWRKLIIVKCPQPRERHCIYLKSKNINNIDERELIVFGGISHYNENTNDIWLMKIQNEREGKN